MYQVAKCKYQKKAEQLMDGWILIHVHLYPFWPNKFLHKMNNGSPNTAKQYAYKLCKFLNYLEDVWSLDYRQATTHHLHKFFTYMLYGPDINIISLTEANRSGFTLRSYYSVIKSFYSYLYTQNLDLRVELQTSKTSVSKHSYLYGQHWEDEKTRLFVDNSYGRGKPPVQYEKWYNEEQVQAILSNFNKYRDKAIFSISLDGLRIDEIISLRLHDYNSSEGILYLYKSKGKQDGNVNRICVLSEQSRVLLEEYLFNERDFVETKLLTMKQQVPEHIFLNIKNSANSFGKPVGYHNLLERIKGAAKKAGLDPRRIRTHSGRSTKAGELFYEQAQNPKELTDNQILEIMGWSNMSSAEPYKNRQDKKTAIDNWKRLNELKEKRHGKNNK